MSKAQESFKTKCELWFKQADKSGDGALTIQELHHMLSANTQMTDRQIAEMFVDLDKDGDRKVTWAEFGDVLKKNPKDVEESELKAAFKSMDTDGSGWLGRAELKAAFLKVGTSLSEDAMDAVLDKADKNGDGKIDYNEFFAAWGKGK